jgi:hypothetical protein
MTFTVEQIGYQELDLDDGTPMKVINWDMEEINYFDIAFLLKDGVANKQASKS